MRGWGAGVLTRSEMSWRQAFRVGNHEFQSRKKASYLNPSHWWHHHQEPGELSGSGHRVRGPAFQESSGGFPGEPFGIVSRALGAERAEISWLITSLLLPRFLTLGLT